MKIHESFCVLSELHAGPCSEHEAECYVLNDEGAVLWREAGDDTATKERCVKAAWRLGFLPSVRHHSNFTDRVEFPVEVREETDRGDLILTLPMGKFRLAATRVRKGDLLPPTPRLGVSGAAGIAASSTDNESPPVKIFGRVNKSEYSPSGYDFQASCVEYADGTKSGFLGCHPHKLERVE